MKNFLISLFMFSLILSCGEGIVKVENVSYEPKIVVEGFLVPGKKVEKIRIMRNFKLDENVNIIGAVVDPLKTKVELRDEQSGRVYILNLHVPDDRLDINGYYFEYTGNDLEIENKKSYTLKVETEIDGKNLWTKSTTTVPPAGFKINSVNFDSLRFAQAGQNGAFELFELSIQRAPGVTFYVNTMRAIQNDSLSFIRNHLVGKLDQEFYKEHFNEISYRARWIQNTPEYVGESTIRLFWLDIYFYSKYEVIVYAADENYRKFLQTYNRVQEFDGNFHEASFSFEGDGIGVFGSVVSDTVYVNVTR